MSLFRGVTEHQPLRVLNKLGCHAFWLFVDFFWETFDQPVNSQSWNFHICLILMIYLKWVTRHQFTWMLNKLGFMCFWSEEFCRWDTGWNFKQPMNEQSCNLEIYCNLMICLKLFTEHQLAWMLNKFGCSVLKLVLAPWCPTILMTAILLSSPLLPITHTIIAFCFHMRFHWSLVVQSYCLSGTLKTFILDVNPP